jgi:hypothetical protein
MNLRAILRDQPARPPNGDAHAVSLGIAIRNRSDQRGVAVPPIQLTRVKIDRPGVIALRFATEIEPLSDTRASAPPRGARLGGFSILID